MNVTINNDTGTIVKTSSDAKKLVAEINWFLSIPKELKYYVPHIYDFSCDPKSPFLEMEFYSYPTLDDCFIYARYDFDSWEKIFTKLFAVIKTASKYTVKDGDLGCDLQDMYVRKTRSRLSEFMQDGLLDTRKSLSLDGASLMPLSEVFENLGDILRDAGLCETKSFQIIHGDICFGNILYDVKHGLIKLIDARGRFGRHSIYGDVYYDLAKLSHSVLGLYDFIKYGQYKLERTGDEAYEIRWRCSEYHNKIGQIFIKHLRENGYDIQKVRLAESLLFLSMLPLHRDCPDHQKIMLLRGLEIFSSCVENKV